MCLQCCTEAKYIAEFAPGWHIVQATISVDEWTAGQYALGRVDDPPFILDTDLHYENRVLKSEVKRLKKLLQDSQNSV